jgi:hypothetical protein
MTFQYKIPNTMEETNKESEQQIKDKEPELFSTINDVSEGDSQTFRNGVIAFLGLLAVFIGSMIYKYIKHHN